MFFNNKKLTKKMEQKMQEEKLFSITTKDNEKIFFTKHENNDVFIICSSKKRICGSILKLSDDDMEDKNSFRNSIIKKFSENNYSNVGELFQKKKDVKRKMLIGQGENDVNNNNNNQFDQDQDESLNELLETLKKRRSEKEPFDYEDEFIGQLGKDLTGEILSYLDSKSLFYILSLNPYYFYKYIRLYLYYTFIDIRVFYTPTEDDEDEDFHKFFYLLGKKIPAFYVSSLIIPDGSIKYNSYINISEYFPNLKKLILKERYINMDRQTFDNLEFFEFSEVSTKVYGMINDGFPRELRDLTLSEKAFQTLTFTSPEKLVYLDVSKSRSLPEQDYSKLVNLKSLKLNNLNPNEKVKFPKNLNVLITGYKYFQFFDEDLNRILPDSLEELDMKKNKGKYFQVNRL